MHNGNREEPAARNDDTEATPPIQTTHPPLAADTSTAQVLERVTDACLALDAQWRVVYLNEKAARALGRTRQDLLGNVLWAELPEGIGGPFYRAYALAMSTQVPTHFEDYAPTRAKWFENHLYPSPEGLTVFFTDITERKRTEQALQETNEWLRLALRGGRLASGRVDLATRQFLNVSDDYKAHFGLPPDADFSLDTLVQAIHPEDRPLVRAAFEQAVAGRHEYNAEYRVVWPDGSVHWISAHGNPILETATGRAVNMIGVVQDITERKNAEDERKHAAAALRESEQRLRLALASARLGTWQYDVSSHELMNISDQCKAHYGLPPEASVTAAELLQATHADDRESLRQTVYRAAEERHDYTVEFRCLWPDGSVHWIHTQGTLNDEAGRAVSLIGVTQEITERKELDAQREQALREAEERADRDPLTGLLNHRAFYKRLEEETRRAAREGTSVAVAVLDLDNFKFFNDLYGHPVGDEVLQIVADRLSAICRPYDVVSRFGGDEFALLLGSIGSATHHEIETRLRSQLGGLTFLPERHGVAITITLSLGVALFPDHSSERLEVVKRADERLLRAKTDGGSDSEADGVRAAVLDVVEGFSLLDALVTAVDNKDRYTRRHSEDVMEYSLMIARQLGLDGTGRQTVAVAALLHDVGKIGVPDAILRKPGALTQEEFAAVKQHPQMGAIIVSAVPGLEDTLDAVRHHHERWDGGGYPLGLRGEETPLIARLMAVADAFSAMTTDRPYRQGMDRAKALSILEEGAGTQWDPQCVAVFVAELARHRSEGPVMNFEPRAD